MQFLGKIAPESSLHYHDPWAYFHQAVQIKKHSLINFFAVGTMFTSWSVGGKPVLVKQN